MPNPLLLACGPARLEVCRADDLFLGIGRVWIDDVLVRSGRLPWRPMTQTYAGGLELARLDLAGVEAKTRELRIRLRAFFRPAFTQIMWDHSTDPIHDLSDWDGTAAAGEGELDLVLRPATDRFGDVDFTGFAFHYEYRSRDVPLFFLYDRASWELDGDITGATAVSQSSCSPPVATFARDTAWTTEGLIHWADPKSVANPVMTHNLPRWASHQAFDYQSKGDRVLLGVFARVALIRSVLRRETGKPELKVFDKYLFDQGLRVATTPKAILLGRGAASRAGQQNLWSWTFDEVHRRARAEFGLAEEPLRQRLNVNYWHSFTIDTYYRDLLPAAAAIGVEAVFVDNLKKSNMTARQPFGTMCCSHEFEIAPELGGPAALKAMIARFAAHGITVYSWTNPNWSSSSPLFYASELSRKLGSRDWCIVLPDARSPYCGAYIPEGGGWDLTHPAARAYWVEAHKRILAETGHRAYLWDSFYNSAFMTLTYAQGRPHPTWPGVLQAMKELQDAGIHCMIESFGPFGEVQHGCPKSYNLDNLFACYKILLGTGYTTIPSGATEPQAAPYPVPEYYRILAHMSKPDLPLWFGRRRIDELFGVAHRRALHDYNTQRCAMARRFLQEDGRAVLWHDAAGRAATLWNFAGRTVALPGRVEDVTAGEALPRAPRYRLRACHTYRLSGLRRLPEQVG